MVLCEARGWPLRNIHLFSHPSVRWADNKKGTIPCPFCYRFVKQQPGSSLDQGQEVPAICVAISFGMSLVSRRRPRLLFSTQQKSAKPISPEPPIMCSYFTRRKSSGLNLSRNSFLSVVSSWQIRYGFKLFRPDWYFSIILLTVNR